MQTSVVITHNLDQYRAVLVGELEKQKHALAEWSSALDELARATDQEAVDARGLTCRLQARTQEAISDIERALARLDDGTYGQCAACGTAINESRLEALPATRFCIDCATAPVRTP